MKWYLASWQTSILSDFNDQYRSQIIVAKSKAHCKLLVRRAYGDHTVHVELIENDGKNDR